MSFLPEPGAELSAAEQAEWDAFAERHPGRLTNMKRVLLADGPSFRAYMEWYTLFDALIRYDLGKVSPRLEGVTVGVNATNIFDKRYLTSCYANYGWCWYGNRRTVQGTIGFTW